MGSRARSRAARRPAMDANGAFCTVHSVSRWDGGEVERLYDAVARRSERKGGSRPPFNKPLLTFGVRRSHVPRLCARAASRNARRVRVDVMRQIADFGRAQSTTGGIHRVPTIAP